MDSKLYILAPNCIIVNGAVNSVLMDLQRQSFKSLTKKQKKILKKEICETDIVKLDPDDQEFLNLMIREDILIKVPKNTLSSFPTINNQFYNSTEINNFIIELNSKTISNIEKIISSLNNLGCKFVEFRVNGDINLQILENSLRLFEKTTIQSIDIFYKYKDTSTFKKLSLLKKQISEIRWIYIYETPAKIINALNEARESGFLYINHGIHHSQCGQVSPFYFSVNIPTYTESVHYNSCLNCKISIDGKGEIRNCPSIKESHGNIKNVSLEDVVRNNNYGKLGEIRKDQISGCKDCEFRYMCTDCRAYIEDPSDIYSKPLKCGYDPYTGNWEDWKVDPKKQKALIYYSIKHSI